MSLKKRSDPWPGGSVGWSIVPYTTKVKQFRFLVRAHTWVAGSIPSKDACGRQLIDVSLSYQCFPLSLSKINKNILGRFKKETHDNFFVKREKFQVIIGEFISLFQWLPTRSKLLPQGYLAMSRGIFGCHDLGGEGVVMVPASGGEKPRTLLISLHTGQPFSPFHRITFICPKCQYF